LEAEFALFLFPRAFFSSLGKEFCNGNILMFGLNHDNWDMMYLMPQEKHNLTRGLKD